jgi:hypothetical protein
MSTSHPRRDPLTLFVWLLVMVASVPARPDIGISGSYS